MYVKFFDSETTKRGKVYFLKCILVFDKSLTFAPVDKIDYF